jgi:hypothetical protein
MMTIVKTYNVKFLSKQQVFLKSDAASTSNCKPDTAQERTAFGQRTKAALNAAHKDVQKCKSHS